MTSLSMNREGWRPLPVETPGSWLSASRAGAWPGPRGHVSIHLLAVCGSYALATVTEVDGPGAGHSEDVVIMRPRPTLVASQCITTGSVYWAVVVDVFDVVDVRCEDANDARVNVLQLVDPDIGPTTGLDDDEDLLIGFAQAAGPSDALEAAFAADWMPGYARTVSEMAPCDGWVTSHVQVVPGEDARGLLDVGEIRTWDAGDGLVLARVGDTPGGPPFTARLRAHVVAPGRCGPWIIERRMASPAGVLVQFVPDTSGQPL
jgi:hypothetical protein